ncbi:hypothetical protein ACET3Z_000654 [Daucus carota]
MATKLTLISLFFFLHSAASAMYSYELLHRFSDELKAFGPVKNGAPWPKKASLAYYKMLAANDAWRRNNMMKLVSHSSVVFPVDGSDTQNLGNAFGWLHYTWIDIGMPAVSFLVALDTGSDLSWVPCECVQCAPLSASFYDLDRDLHMYNPSSSSSGKILPCTHKLCELGTSCGNPNSQCPYNVTYLSENVSSSGLLVEDVIHLVSRRAEALNHYVRSPVIIGCGKRQGGEFLDGIAPDGLLGLGVREISVPSFLAKAGVIKNSFSLCFSEHYSGKIYLGDQGPSTQQTTSLLPLDGKFTTYITGVEACCIGDSCLNQTNFKALIDCGTSFTHFPSDVYEIVVKEFDRQINSTKISNDPWEYCYNGSSSRSSKVPSVVLKFGKNNTFLVHTPVIDIFDDQGISGFCLAIHPTDSNVALIGQNYLRGYRMVFDRENLKLGWSPSDCGDDDSSESSPHSPPQNGSASNPFPDLQNAIHHANAGPDESIATRLTAGRLINMSYLENLLLLLLAFHQLVCIA